MTANKELLDATLRHQIGVRRFSAGEARRALELLEKVDRDLTTKLRVRLAAFGGVFDFRSRRFKALLEDIREARKAYYAEFRATFRSTLFEFATLEVDFENRIAGQVIPIEVNFAAVPPAQLRAIVVSRPFQGRFLRDWFRKIEADDRARIRTALQLGMAEGESIQGIVARIAGTRAEGFRFGALAAGRRDVEMVVRTAVNHVSNRAREAFWIENSDFVSGLVWTATLDGRTTRICAGRDGKFVPIGGGSIPEGFELLLPRKARPPAHPSCRSVMVAILDGEGILGKRPFVTDTRTRRRREIDFRRLARERGVPIQAVRSQWAAENVGTVPAKTSYNQFLRRQSAAFQNETLGRSKGALFRRGGLKMDEFVDIRGNELTLSQLADTRPEAFIRAGLDPDDF